MSELHDMMNKPRGPGYTLDGQPTRWADYYTTHPAHSSPPYQDAPEVAETPAAQGGAKLETHHDERNTGLALKGCCLVVACAAVLILAGCGAMGSFPVTEMLIASPTASQDGQGAFFIVQGSPVAVIAATEPKQPKTAASPTPDAGATQAADNRAGERDHDAAILAQKQADAQKAASDAARIDSQNTQTAYSIVAATTADAVELRKIQIAATQDTAHATQTAIAPAQALEAARDYERVKWAWLEAFAGPIFQLLAGIGIVGMGVAGIMAMRRPHVEQVQEAAPEEKVYHSDYADLRPIPALGTLRVVIVPAGVTRPHVALLAQGVARTGNEHGIPFTRSNWRDTFPRAEWDALIAWMLDPKQMYVRKVQPEKDNSPVVFTPQGEQWLSMFESDPPPGSEYPISAALSAANPAGQA